MGSSGKRCETTSDEMRLHIKSPEKNSTMKLLSGLDSLMTIKSSRYSLDANVISNLMLPPKGVSIALSVP
jgi:hypothetical protein